MSPNVQPEMRNPSVPSSTSSAASRLGAFVILGLVALLTACGGGPQSRPAVVIDRTDSSSPGSDRGSNAEQLYESGRFALASTAFERAAGASIRDSGHFLVRAADSAWRAQNGPRTNELLARIEPASLDQSDRALAQLLQLASSPAQIPPRAMLDRLTEQTDSLPPYYQLLHSRMRSSALADSGRYFQAALVRIDAAKRLSIDDAESAAENNRRIVSYLRAVPEAQIRNRAEAEPIGTELHGWLMLVIGIKDAVFGQASMDEAFAQWQRRYPQHPAATMTADQLLGEQSFSFQAPRSIALIIPQTGNLASAAEGLRDGFMAAHFASDRQSTIRVYDSGSDAQRSIEAYHQAIADGADMIVGPLEKDAVNALILEADGDVPVLTLNYADIDAPAAPGVYQFGLLPEDEARTAADRMLADGFNRAVVLAPASEWGERVAGAFMDRYTALGGSVFEAASYEEGQGDFAEIIERIVGLTASKSRHRQLQGELNTPLEFVARPRQDLSAIFMAARTREGRLIVPQLDFHDAAHIPVYSTSHVYTGTPDATADRDLKNVRFCDSPWLIGADGFALDVTTARRSFRTAGGRSTRLFAAGMDAYDVISYLPWLAEIGADRFPGTTGQLSMDNQGRVRRDTACAQFRNGRAVLLGPPREQVMRRG